MLYDWILSTLVIAIIFDRAVLWCIPRIVSARAIAAIRRRAGGVNRLVFHGLNTPMNCRTPLSTADALMTLCPYDVSVTPLRLSLTIPDDTDWSICCYGPNADNIFAMNDSQLPQRTGSNVFFALHTEGFPVEKSDNEISIPLKSAWNTSDQNRCPRSTRSTNARETGIQSATRLRYESMMQDRPQ